MRWLPVLMAVGCVHQVPVPDPGNALPFAFSGRPTFGEVRVVPAIALHDAISLNTSSYLGAALPYRREAVRRERTRDLVGLPESIGLALPGEVNAELGLSWAGQFHLAGLPGPQREKVVDALQGRRVGLDATLGEAAAAVGGNATLFTWVSELSGDPLTVQGFPGEVVDTPVGPVVVDHEDEPYLVTAQIGMALVTADGEVVVRYQDTYETILSGACGRTVAGRQLARAVAEQATMVWGNEPRLRENEPETHFSSNRVDQPNPAIWTRNALR